jgi:hypothetical protein
LAVCQTTLPPSAVELGAKFLQLILHSHFNTLDQLDSTPIDALLGKCVHAFDEEEALFDDLSASLRAYKGANSTSSLAARRMPNVCPEIED